MRAKKFCTVSKCTASNMILLANLRTRRIEEEICGPYFLVVTFSPDSRSSRSSSRTADLIVYAIRLGTRARAHPLWRTISLLQLTMHFWSHACTHTPKEIVNGSCSECHKIGQFVWIGWGYNNQPIIVATTKNILAEMFSFRSTGTEINASQVSYVAYVQ